MSALAQDDVVARLAWALLHFVWQGALIGAIAAAGLAVLRDSRPQARYAFSGAMLLLCLALPLAQLLTPAAPGTAAVPLFIAPAEPAAATLSPHAIAAVGVVEFSIASLRPGLSTVVLAWSIGAALMALRLLAGLVWVQRLGAVAGAAVDPVWQERLAVLAARMGLQRLPRLRVLAIPGLDGPVTVGRWRPLIVLPAALLARLPVELVEALLAHELAHVRRLDYLANLLQSVVEVLLFYHPVVWWLGRRIRIEREQIADDLAVQALGDPRRLARALAALADYQAEYRAEPAAHAADRNPPNLAIAAHGGSLMNRIERLLRPAQRPLGWKPLLSLTGLAALALVAQAAGLSTPGAPPAPAAPAQAATRASAPVAPVVAVAQTAAKGATTITLGDGRQPFAFALVSARDDSMTMSGNGRDMREIEARRSAFAGDFLWIRQDKLRYVVTDAAAVAEARALWTPVHAFDAEMEKLGAQIEAHAATVERAAREVEAAHAKPLAELAALEKKMAALEKQRRKPQAEIEKLSRRIERTRDEKLLAQLERQVEAIEKTLEPLDADMEALSGQIEQIGDAHEQAMQKAMGGREQEAEKAMEQLSRQMEALGAKQEAAAKAAEQQLRALIQDFVKRGLAKAA